MVITSSPPPSMLLVINDSRAKRDYCKGSSVARQLVVERSDTTTREAKPTELMEDCNDDE